jgi:hypothetical protein
METGDALTGIGNSSMGDQALARQVFGLPPYRHAPYLLDFG